MTYLDLWKVRDDPGSGAPYSSITHWTWDELHWNDRRFSCSKREAYVEIIELPRLSGCPMTLAAARGDPEDKVGDKRLFESQGWTMVEPWTVAGSPEDYVPGSSRKPGQKFARLSRSMWR